MDMNLSKLQELEMDKEASHAAAYGVTKSWTWLSDWTELEKKKKKKKHAKWQKTVLRKNIVEGITLPDSKLHYNTTESKMYGTDIKEKKKFT